MRQLQGYWVTFIVVHVPTSLGSAWWGICWRWFSSKQVRTLLFKSSISEIIYYIAISLIYVWVYVDSNTNSSCGGNIVVNLKLDSIPLLRGAADCVGMGILSSLQPQNIRCARAVGNIHLGEGKLWWSNSYLYGIKLKCDLKTAYI